MKKQIVLLMVLLTTLLLTGCGTDEGKQAAKSAVDDISAAESLFEDNSSLNKLIDELRNTPALKGKELHIFQTFQIDEDMLQDRYVRYMKIFLLKPGTEKQVIAYEYSTSKEKKWLDPQPVKVSGDGAMADNLVAFNDIHIENVPAMCKQTREKAAALKNVKIGTVRINLMPGDLRPYWLVQFTGMKGDSLIYGSAKFDLQGNLTQYDQNDQK